MAEAWGLVAGVEEEAVVGVYLSQVGLEEAEGADTLPEQREVWSELGVGAFLLVVVL